MPTPLYFSAVPSPASVNAPTSTPGDEARHPSAPGSVLYVDDHPLNVLLMRSLFRHRPALRLTAVASGAAALQSAMAEPPALLLLDLRLPDMGGIELLGRIRRLPALSTVPAVALSAEGHRTACAAAGFCESWRQPLDRRGVLAALDRLLRPRAVAALRPEALAGG